MSKKGINHEERAHARFSPSAMGRIVHCPGSVLLGERVEKVYPKEDSPFAEEGTTAHELSEILINLELGRLSLELAGPEMEKIEKKCLDNKWDHQEMMEHSLGFRDYVMDIVKSSPGATVLVEAEVTLEPLGVKDCWGTLDIAIMEPFGKLHIIDLKYGRGVAVSAEINYQLITYGLGVYDEHDKNFAFESVHYHIYQPRIFDATNDYAQDTEVALAYVDIIKKAAEQAEKPFANRRAGDWCRWCPGKALCPTVMKSTIELLERSPSAIEMSPGIVADLLKTATLAQQWADEFWSLASSQAKRGNIPYGFKLVRGKRSRSWINENAVKEEFKDLNDDELYTKKLISPARLEKIVGEEQVKPFVEVSDGNLTLVPESDKRKAVDNRNDAAAAVFDAIDDKT